MELANILIQIFLIAGTITLIGIALWIGIEAWLRFLDRFKAHIWWVQWTLENADEFREWVIENKIKKKRKEEKSWITEEENIDVIKK